MTVIVMMVMDVIAHVHHLMFATLTILTNIMLAALTPQQNTPPSLPGKRRELLKSSPPPSLLNLLSALNQGHSTGYPMDAPKGVTTFTYVLQYNTYARLLGESSATSGVVTSGNIVPTHYRTPTRWSPYSISGLR